MGGFRSKASVRKAFVRASGGTGPKVMELPKKNTKTKSCQMFECLLDDGSCGGGRVRRLLSLKQSVCQGTPRM